MIGLFSVAQVRAIEKAAAALLPDGALMERAGRAAADQALQLLSGISSPKVLVAAGPGNNGGDALEVGAHLAQANVDVAIFLTHPDQPYTSSESQRALARAHASSAEFIMDFAGREWDLAIDGMFGIGLHRPIEGRALLCLNRLNAAGKPVLALDCPSGLNADTGGLVGEAVRATHTATFIADKPGLRTGAGRERAGVVTVHPLGIDPLSMGGTSISLNGAGHFPSCRVPRGVDSHKGSFGDVVIIGGAPGMAGAPVLAARAALYGGAGRVLCGMLADALPYDPVQPEVMFRDADSVDMETSAVVIGPGLGNSTEAIKLLLRAFKSNAPLVVDADALNLLALSDDLRQRLHARGEAILTPHPLEAARLLQTTTAAIQSDRLASAAQLSSLFNSVVILKGAGTVIALPDGRRFINDTGNPGLATAGTGDVLAGVIGSLLAQGWPLHEAALGAVYMHGLAADELVAAGTGPVGLVASELPRAIRAARNALARRYGQQQ